MDATKQEIATLGGGCFWCLEAVFTELRGVEKVTSGYAGGQVDQPTYEDVCSGSTGHAEVIQIAFDPKVISYRDLMQLFMTFHDPTTLNRQGPDRGTQYRSIILYHSPEQEAIARQVIQDFGKKKVYRDPIVTEVKPLETFYPAEEYHNDYYRRNPDSFYCRINIDPKLAKLRKSYAERIKK